jgi:hypothetical protein
MSTTYPQYQPNATRVNVAAKAAKVATIFNTLAIVVLVIGGIFALVAVIAGIAVIADGDFFSGLFITGVYLVAVGIYTALSWAWITMGTIVAGYIANRTE